MKKYIKKMLDSLRITHPDAECNCYEDSAMDEEFLCDLCLSRLKKQRGKLKRRDRFKTKKKNLAE